jgi:hypothetical protein
MDTSLMLNLSTEILHIVTSNDEELGGSVSKVTGQSK